VIAERFFSLRASSRLSKFFPSAAFILLTASAVGLQKTRRKNKKGGSRKRANERRLGRFRGGLRLPPFLLRVPVLLFLFLQSQSYHDRDLFSIGF
jgi:membrane protease YdiL (CAAX protease family)